MTLGSDEDSISRWEEAYLRFETPREEQRKFIRRLKAAGAATWPRDSVILDLFCGRGGGAQALRRLGFTHVVGLDLSRRLLVARSDASECAVADCRTLPIATRSADIAVVQGGLHHLPSIPDDLSVTFAEIARVLRPKGLFVAVEPWRTPFLDFVHRAASVSVIRRSFSKINALATMIECERHTYEAWLSDHARILALFDRYFVPRELRIRRGKLHYVGVPR